MNNRPEGRSGSVAPGVTSSTSTNKPSRQLWWRIGAVAVLIVAYIVVAALELSVSIVAPIIVIAIAAVLFWPAPQATKNTDQSR